MSDQKDPNVITLPNVRLSFPHLFVADAMEEGKPPVFSAIFLLDNTVHGDLLDRIDAQINRLALDEWKKKVNFKRCLRDGNEKSEMDGYGDGISFINAWCKTRPGVVDRMLNPVAESDGIIYAGCYVNATIRLFPWEHKTGGKGISAQLRAVQFLRDGESFGAGPVDATKEFEAIKDDGDSAQPSEYSRRSRGGKPASSIDDF